MAHHSTTRAETLKGDRERNKKNRDALKDAGAPTTHVLNRALAEGFLYYIDAGRAQGLAVSDIAVSAQDVLVYANAVLIRKTNGTDQYDKEAVRQALRKRIYRKSDSKFRIKTTWVSPDDDD
ncbi:MAG: hypothetical protein ACOH2L_19200 [Devosia sp.]